MRVVYGWMGSDAKNMLILPTENVDKIVANSEKTLFVTSCGKLYIGQYNEDKKGFLKHVSLEDLQVKDVAIFKNNIIIVTLEGLVFTYDEESEARHPITLCEPKKTCCHGQEEEGRKVLVDKVSAGVDHIMYLSQKGEVWVQGRGSALGLFKSKLQNDATNPTRLDFFIGRRILEIKTGNFFTLAHVESLPVGSDNLSFSESSSDLDSFVTGCEGCRKETGDRILFQETDNIDKCPLGLGFQHEEFSTSSVYNALPSVNVNIKHEKSNKESISEYSENFIGTSIKACNESKSNIEMKSIRKRETSSESEFEILESSINQISDKENEVGALSMTKDAAKQFFSKSLSWVTSSSESSDITAMECDRSSYKYPIDTATEMIKGNVVSAANLVATGVKTVGDKMGQISRHFSSSDVEPNCSNSSSDSQEKTDFTVSADVAPHNYSSREWNSVLRSSPEINIKKTHTRTASAGGISQHILGKEMFVLNRKVEDLSVLKANLVESGRNISNSEIWCWGSSRKGELGLGDQVERATPCNITSLNHVPIIKITCGNTHAACLTIDGKVYIWGCLKKGTISSSSPILFKLPDKEVAKDVASGEDFVVIVSIQGKVYFVENLCNEKNSDHIKNIVLHDGFTQAHSILCHSQSIVCTSGALHSKVRCFMKSEMEFLSRMNTAIHHVIVPMLELSNSKKHTQKHNTSKSDTESFTSSVSTSSVLSSYNDISFESDTNSPGNQSVLVKIKQAKIKLLQTFVTLSYIVTSALREVMDNQLKEIAQALSVIYRAQELRSAFKDYSKVLFDAVALGGTNLETKEGDTIVEKSKSYISFEGEDNLSNSDFFFSVLLIPVKRMKDYETDLCNIKSDTGSFYSPFALEQIKAAHNLWKESTTEAAQAKVEAENTRAFWVSCSNKMFEGLANSSRRIRMDSKKTPLNLANSGRFSSHSFILMSDVFVHCSYNNFVVHGLSSMWVEPLPMMNNNQNALQITVPEDSFVLTCQSGIERSQWLQALQDSINECVERVPYEGVDSNRVLSRSPPLIRNASYTFTKHPLYRDATYTGQWFCGQMQHEGSLSWPNGKRYSGQFRGNEYQGFGRLQIPYGQRYDVYVGTFKRGKLEGRGVIRYANGDVYVGFLHENLPHGHGELKSGNFGSDAASVYTGEWYMGVKHGYGVLDEITKGEKYLGMWQNNNRHGSGMVVTMNDVYYEGNFSQNKLNSFGVMILDDGTVFEGELGAGGICNGKGTMRFANGDYMEGSFWGSCSEGIKVNGVLRKCSETQDKKDLPSFFSKLSVPSHQKWKSLFRYYEEQLGMYENSTVDTSKAWSLLAAVIEKEKQVMRHSNKHLVPLDGLDKILDVAEEINFENLKVAESYLEKAFSSDIHPFGQLLQSFVNTFRATYGGVVAHSLLLDYAVQEVWSCTGRLYRIAQLLFPSLPEDGLSVTLESEGEGSDDLVVTPAYIIHPWLLPHLYASLSPLYARHHQKNDNEYWQRLLKWNKQSDIALMTFLGVDVKFWLSEGENLAEKSLSMSSVKDQHFTEAIESLQLISTSFTPKSKLLLIRQCGFLINKEAAAAIGPGYVLCMDDLLPLFLYVVVRSRIQHLGAEISFIDHLSDTHLRSGELDHVFTTLRACYYHILHEKPSAYAHLM